MRVHGAMEVNNCLRVQMKSFGLVAFCYLLVLVAIPWSLLNGEIKSKMSFFLE